MDVASQASGDCPLNIHTVNSTCTTMARAHMRVYMCVCHSFSCVDSAVFQTLGLRSALDSLKVATYLREGSSLSCDWCLDHDNAAATKTAANGDVPQQQVQTAAIAADLKRKEPSQQTDTGGQPQSKRTRRK